MNCNMRTRARILSRFAKVTHSQALFEPGKKIDHEENKENHGLVTIQ